AQKAFRERKDARIRELEDRVNFLETQLSTAAEAESLAADNAALRATIDSLQAAVADAQTQNHLLHAELRRLANSDPALPPASSAAAAASVTSTGLSLSSPRIGITYTADRTHPGGGPDTASSAQSPDSDGRRSNSFLDTVL
ncbi:hypothetical protein HDU84_009437, partial [Entophlyctis sp. JEL0112]